MDTALAKDESGREGDLLRRFLDGEPAACWMVERWAWEIILFKWYSIPLDERDDIVRDTVAGVWHAASRRDFALKVSLRALVRRVATMRCIDRLRERRPTTSHVESLAHPGPDPYQDLLARDRTAQLQCALERLDERCRDIIRLHFWDDLPYAEIAARMERSEATMRVRMFNCVKALRGLLTPRAE